MVVSDQGSRCQVNVLVPHESMSYTVCQDQVSTMTYIKYRCLISSAVDQVSNITYQAPVSDIKCHGSGIKYNISSVGAINHTSSITCQVSVSDVTCQV